MIHVKLTTNKGYTWTTRINQDFKGASDYFLNRWFNCGVGEDGTVGEDMQKVIKIEELEPIID